MMPLNFNLAGMVMSKAAHFSQLKLIFQNSALVVVYILFFVFLSTKCRLDCIQHQSNQINNLNLSITILEDIAV